MARLRSNTQISLSVLSIRERRPGPGHLSPRWSQPALSLCLKVTVGGRREPRPTSTGMEPPAPSTPDEDINTIVTPIAPTVTYTGPITRARARQSNYQVLSFLGNASNVHENMMLPKLD